MAATNGVWGIDIGQCALKALRCEYDNDNKILVATAFDYIEHPKILSQPDANPKELITEALNQFLERNELKGDRVAISVPGQSGLARFFEPPPVDIKKLPEIVRFEARQQIPFPLDEVIWDFQLMGGASEVDGFLMEAEVGLFAMKRDQIFEALDPYLAAEIELDIIQLSPLCAYNFVAHNLMTEALEADVYDPDNPPESVVIVSIGTDTTDLVITNGFRVWQRNIPLGGNHFTKQLTKELKLTFAKAEHLKRHVREAEDAKSIIQAMRPVFNDLLTEVQRSIGFFQNIDRKAEISGLIMLGNAVKLPGLQQYLAKNLGYELVDVDHERWAARLAGQTVLTSPQFKENMHAFGVCYGLCLQALGKASLDTNLLPKEILTERIIRAKKPWALATAAGLMLAFAVNFAFEYNEWYKVHPTMERDGVTWEKAMSEVDTVQGQFTQHENDDASRVQRLDELVALGKELSGNSDRRLLWLEMLKAVNQALPVDVDVAQGRVPSPKELPITERKDLHIEYIETQYYQDLATWFSGPVEQQYLLEERIAKGDSPVTADASTSPADLSPPADAGGASPAAPEPGTGAGLPAGAPTLGIGIPGVAQLQPGFGGDATGEDPATASGAAPGYVPPSGAAPAADPAAMDTDAEEGAGPSGPGWVIEIKGHHFYNDEKHITEWMGDLVRNTLMKNLREQTVLLPGGPDRPDETFTMKELGIGYVILAKSFPLDKTHKVPNPYYQGPQTTGGVYGGGGPSGSGIGGPGGMGIGGMAPGGMAPGGMAPGGMAPGGMAPGGMGPGGSAAPKSDPDAEKEETEPPFYDAPKYDFIVQFCWQEQQLTERLKQRELARQQEQLEQQEQEQTDLPDDSVAAADLGG